MTLLVHRGGWEATKADLAAVPVPEPTESYHPVPYDRFVEEVELHVPRFGLKIQSEAFALAQEGNQMFGVLTCVNGKPTADYSLAIGIRNSYNRTISVGLTVGHVTLICTNLAFSGEVTMHRKHTVNVFRDLPDLIYKMLGQVSSMRERTDGEIAAMKTHTVEDRFAHHLMVAATRKHILPASRIPLVLDQWLWPKHEEFKPRTAWSLFNAFTEVQKSASPRVQMDGTLKLSSLFREELSLQ